MSVVTYPAYPDTSVAVRSYEKRKAGLEDKYLEDHPDKLHAADCPRLARCKRLLAETLDGQPKSK